MKKKLLTMIGSVCLILVLAALLLPACAPEVEEEVEVVKEVRIGVLYSVTGAFAPMAITEHRATKLIIDTINDKGGILGEWKILPFYADAQSSPDVGVREAERLITVNNVDVVTGFYSSGVCKPVAPLCEKYKVICWDNGAISQAILEGNHFQYVFQPQAHSGQFTDTVALIADSCEALGVASPAEIKGAVFYEDGPYGTSTGASCVAKMEELGMPLVYEAGYAHDIMDMTSIILGLKESGADVLFHTGYYPDIVLFLKQARELGLTWKALLGHGAGYSDMSMIGEIVGEDLVNYIYNIDPPACQYLDPATLTPEVREWQELFSRELLELYGEEDPRTHYSMGFGNFWILVEKVIPLAIEKYGDVTPDTIRMAALEIDIPDGGTPMGYGAKFAPPEQEYAGQNLRSFTSVYQWIDGKWEIVYPLAIRTMEPVLPLPSGHPFAK